EEALDARSIAMNDVVGDARVVLLPLAGGVEEGHEVFRAREDEDVRFVGIRVTGKRLVRLPCDCRRRQAPAETERSVTVAAVVRQRQRRPETAAPWARRNRDTERARARDGVRRELLADATNGASALRHGDGREATDGSRAPAVAGIAGRRERRALGHSR